MQNTQNEKLHITYDEIDLLEFFESFPICLNEEDDRYQMYIIKQYSLKMCCIIRPYEFIVDISLSYIDPSFPDVDTPVFKDRLTNVLKIEKENDNTLKIICENEKSVLLKKAEELCVSYEHGINDTVISY